MSIGIADVRPLLNPQNPFTVGRYPARLAPVHLMNGFVGAAMGVSPRGAAIRRLLARAELTEGDPSLQIPFLSNSSWKKNPAELSALRTDLSLMFNPDARLWEKLGSMSLVHADLAVATPDDDGIGRLLWGVVKKFGPPESTLLLSEFLRPSDAKDPVTASAFLLVAGADPAKDIPEKQVDRSWYGELGTESGATLAGNLAAFIGQLMKAPDDARRLQQLQHLSRGLQLAAVLSIALGPIAGAYSDPVYSIHELAPLVAWAGMPPGPAGHPMVMSSQRSMNQVLRRTRSSLAQTLSVGLAGIDLPPSLPSDQRLFEAVVAQLAISGYTQDKAETTAEKLVQNAGNSSAKDELDFAGWSARLIDYAYPGNSLPFGLRQIATKIGFIGPNRGIGAPRFMCETPLLGTLVAGLCPGEGMDFEDFVDACRTKLGIVFGPGSSSGLVEELGLWESTGIGRRLLRDNQDELKLRLVRAGLAREYSDGHTEVMDVR